MGGSIARDASLSSGEDLMIPLTRGAKACGAKDMASSRRPARALLLVGCPGRVGTIRDRRWLMKSLAATGLLAASMLAMPASSQADVRIGVGIRLDGHSNRIAYDQGYEDGYHEGRKDGHRRDRYGYWDEGRYRDGDHGYKGRYGPRWEYRNVYRRGFEEGYRRGYRSFHVRYDDRYDDRYRRYDR
jgi:hypothetical protein